MVYGRRRHKLFDKPNTKPTNYALSEFNFSNPNLYFKLSEESIKTAERNETQFFNSSVIILNKKFHYINTKDPSLLISEL